MKRSSSVRLTIMSAATATSLAACDSGAIQPGNYTSVQHCVDAGNRESDCSSAYNAALRAHQEKAPRYSTREECLRSVDVNDCITTVVRNPDGTTTNAFLPLMAGYMLARQQQQSSGSYGGGGGRAFYASRDYPSQYRDSDNLTTSRQSSVDRRASPSTTAAPSRPPNVNTTTIARSGFGSTSRSFGGSSS
jgi:uncharacterized protein YgiB involved in biofilm formation